MYQQQPQPPPQAPPLPGYVNSAYAGSGCYPNISVFEAMLSGKYIIIYAYMYYVSRCMCWVVCIILFKHSYSTYCNTYYIHDVLCYITCIHHHLKGNQPCNPVYEDDDCACIVDGDPQSPLHFLIFPKNKANLIRLSKARIIHEKLLGHMILVAKVCFICINMYVEK